MPWLVEGRCNYCRMRFGLAIGLPIIVGAMRQTMPTMSSWCCGLVLVLLVVVVADVRIRVELWQRALTLDRKRIVPVGDVLGFADPANMSNNATSTTLSQVTCGPLLDILKLPETQPWTSTTIPYGVQDGLPLRRTNGIPHKQYSHCPVESVLFRSWSKTA